MRIEIRFPPPLRRWHVVLGDALAAQGHSVECVDGRRAALPFGVAAALALQRRIFGPSVSMFDGVVRRPSPPSGAPPDLVIALDGSVPAAPSLTLTCNGEQGEAALVALLAGQATPEVRVTACRREGWADVVTANLAVEHRDVLSRGLDQVLKRIVTLLCLGVRRLESCSFEHQPIVSTPAEVPSSSAVFSMSRALLRKIAGRIGLGARAQVRWRIGYRAAAGGVRTHDTWAGAPFTILPDDGHRFYADPMPFAHEGRSYLFFEDMPDATGRGVIGCVEMIDGIASAPRTVLAQPFHLSYPLVLRHDGEIYMLPEMSGARRLQLFRAAPFPDRWVADRVLLDGLVAADATPVRHGGRWWLFASLADDGGSSWDQLALFHAPDLLGPWEPHRGNPVLIDAGAARPAGAMWHENGVLMRVAQDCRRGYGDGLAICRVDRLDEDGYAQTVVRRLGPPPVDGADGVHTLNRLGDLEVIDVRGGRGPHRRRAILRGAERD